MANRSINRGPKTPIGRLNSLRNLRGVGEKIFKDRKYADDILTVGMNYKTQKEKRLATKITNQYDRKIKKHIIKKKSPDLESLKEWRDNYSDDDQMTLDEAIELRKTIDQSKPKPEPKFELKPAVRKSYSSGLYNPKYSTPQWQPLEQIGKKKVYPKYY